MLFERSYLKFPTLLFSHMKKTEGKHKHRNFSLFSLTVITPGSSLPFLKYIANKMKYKLSRATHRIISTAVSTWSTFLTGHILQGWWRGNVPWDSFFPMFHLEMRKYPVEFLINLRLKNWPNETAKQLPCM